MALPRAGLIDSQTHLRVPPLTLYSRTEKAAGRTLKHVPARCRFISYDIYFLFLFSLRISFTRLTQTRISMNR